MKKLLIIWCCCIAWGLLPAQTDSLPDAQILPEVVVRDSVSTPISECGPMVIHIEKRETPPPVALSELLANIPLSLHLKTAGPGSLSTVTMRGHSASQTDILLDGFSIRSNMNGVYDLSLLPTYFTRTVSVLANSDLNHHGRNIGGQIGLETPVHSYDRWTVEAGGSLGSYMDGRAMLGAEGFWDKNRKKYSVFRSFYRSSQNDFPYDDTSQIGRPRKELENASFRQYGFLQNNKLTFKEKNTFESKLWYVNNHREIPPTISQGTSTAFQDDELLNGILSWERQWKKRHRTKLNARYANEHIYYNSPIVETDSRSNVYEGRLTWDYQINKQQSLEAETGHTYAIAKVEDYHTDAPSQHQTYLSGKYRYEYKGFDGRLQLREDLVNGDFSPMLGQVYLSYDFDHEDIIKGFKLGFSTSRDYRRPTFNDLYWKTGAFESGNPDLLPESAWKEEISLRYNYHYVNRIDLYSYLNFFHSKVDNWILWAPNNSGIWTPENIKKVRSKGVELQADLFYHPSNRFVINISPQYQYTHSTNIEISNNSTNTLGKQLLYVPRHSGGATFQFQYKHLLFNYQHNITGKRYTTTDNSESLPRYHVANVNLSYLFKLKKYQIEPLLEIKNLYNHDYQVVADRPMPPLHIQATIYFRWGAE